MQKKEETVEYILRNQCIGGCL